MKLLLLSILFISLSASAQTYPKYTGNKAVKDTFAGKPKAAPKAKVKTEAEKPLVLNIPKESKITSGNFQDFMNRGVEQFKSGKHTEAVKLYTKALSVATEEQAWRALISRASVYSQMKKYDLSLKDCTTIIDNNNIPEKQLGTTYMARARYAQELNDMQLACSDVKKAKEMGLPPSLTQGIRCD
ncbi:MAG: hypothetical protein EOO07_38935 [Chitinophagaceae bacterium]|nr:MAG: hypothetical protein EOO07_38935 [Chitinophagaceae bacterium]